MEINTLAAFRASSTKWHVNIAQGRNHGRNLVVVDPPSPKRLETSNGDLIDLTLMIYHGRKVSTHPPAKNKRAKAWWNKTCWFGFSIAKRTTSPENSYVFLKGGHFKRKVVFQLPTTIFQGSPALGCYLRRVPVPPGSSKIPQLPWVWKCLDRSKWRPSRELFGWFKEGIQDQVGGVWENLGGGFKHFSFYPDPWGNDAISLILFKWIETIRKTRCPWFVMGCKSQSKGYKILYNVDFVRTQGRVVSRTGS